MDTEAGSKARGILVKAYALSFLAHGTFFFFLWSGVWPDLKRLPIPVILEVELQEPIRFEARAVGPVSRPRSSLTSVIRLGDQRKEKASDGGQAGKTSSHPPEEQAEAAGEKALSTEPLGKLTGVPGESALSRPPPLSNPSSSQVVQALFDAQAVSQDRQATAQNSLGEDNGKRNGGEALTGAPSASDAFVCCSRSGGEGTASMAGTLAENLRTGIGNGTGGGPGVAGEGGHEGTGVGEFDGLVEYLLALHRKISEHTSYPWEARRNGMTGTVKVALVIGCGGGLAHVELLHGSPFSVLNMAALETVQKVTPLPPPPVGTCQERMRVLIPFTYRLQR